MFLRNRESLHQHIVRKLRAKFIDRNAFYSQPDAPKTEDYPYSNGALQEDGESPQLKQIMNFISLEVSKLLKSKRINEETLTEIDARVAIEVYLREKKVAILEDR